MLRLRNVTNREVVVGRREIMAPSIAVALVVLVLHVIRRDERVPARGPCGLAKNGIHIMREPGQARNALQRPHVDLPRSEATVARQATSRAHVAAHNIALPDAAASPGAESCVAPRILCQKGVLWLSLGLLVHWYQRSICNVRNSSGLLLLNRFDVCDVLCTARYAVALKH